MPVRLRNKGVVPRGGIWRYKQSESGLTLESDSWLGLVDVVKRHRMANGYTIPITFESDIEQGVCELAPSVCVKADGKSAASSRITWGQVAQFTGIMISSLLKGRPKEPESEANRRAQICSQCPDNVQAEGCSGCNSRKIETLVQKVAGTSRTKHDSQLESCRHCGCLNRVQVWFPKEILQKHMDNKVREALPAPCWKK